MSRHAVAGMVLASAVLIVALVSGACVPGAIAHRRGSAKDDAGGPPLGEVTVVRDAAASNDSRPPGSDPAEPGPWGSSGLVTDAATPFDARVPETPKLPPRDAARSVTEDATTDASRKDAAPKDARSDAPSTRAPQRGELVIDEVLVNPIGDDLGREWIEVANLGADWLDLADLHLASASVDVAVAGGLVAPRGLRVLGQSADPTKNGGAPVDVAYGTKLILNNADGRVSICDGACASGIVLDTVSWGALGDETTGHALVVDPVTKTLCAASTPFGTGANFGTPGQPNPPCQENGDAASHLDVSVAD